MPQKSRLYTWNLNLASYDWNQNCRSLIEKETKYVLGRNTWFYAKKYIITQIVWIDWNNKWHIPDLHVIAKGVYNCGYCFMTFAWSRLVPRLHLSNKNHQLSLKTPHKIPIFENNTESQYDTGQSNNPKPILNFLNGKELVWMRFIWNWKLRLRLF